MPLAGRWAPCSFIACINQASRSKPESEVRELLRTCCRWPLPCTYRRAGARATCCAQEHRTRKADFLACRSRARLHGSRERARARARSAHAPPCAAGRQRHGAPAQSGRGGRGSRSVCGCVLALRRGHELARVRHRQGRGGRRLCASTAWVTDDAGSCGRQAVWQFSAAGHHSHSAQLQHAQCTTSKSYSAQSLDEDAVTTWPGTQAHQPRLAHTRAQGCAGRSARARLAGASPPHSMPRRQPAAHRRAPGHPRAPLAERGSVVEGMGPVFGPFSTSEGMVGPGMRGNSDYVLCC